MPDALPETTPVLSVWELTRSIRVLLESEVGSVWVEGEISNLRKQASGHQYFTLKDERSQLPCVLFRGNNNLLAGTTLADGIQVQLFGEITVYEQRGQYQMIVQLMQGKGAGALQARFELLKRKLDAEGLFDPARKRPLPEFPVTVGIVTSPTGAALQDMLHILRRRAPWLRVIIHPVRVQGQGASLEIAQAIIDFNRWTGASRGSAHGKNDAVDLIVIARGGGSIEDLWEFNEEIVARAIAASDLPVVSAVGHEIDFTIADFVADLRAPTPSAAAELIAPDTAELLRQLAATKQFFGRRFLAVLTDARNDLQKLTRGKLDRESRRRTLEGRQRLDHLEELLQVTARNALESLHSLLREKSHCLQQAGPQKSLPSCGRIMAALGEKLEHQFRIQHTRLKTKRDAAEGLLRVLSPRATLERGYSITCNADGKIIRSKAEVLPGQVITTQMHNGSVSSRVEIDV